MSRQTKKTQRKWQKKDEKTKKKGARRYAPPKLELVDLSEIGRRLRGATPRHLIVAQGSDINNSGGTVFNSYSGAPPPEDL